MEKLLTLLFTLLSLSVFSQKLETSHLYISASDKSIFCKEYQVEWTVKSKKIVVISPVLDLNLKIVKKRVGKYKSWLGKDGEKYYTITFLKFKDGSALLFIPVEKNFRILTEVGYLIGNTPELCN